MSPSSASAAAGGQATAVKVKAGAGATGPSGASSAATRVAATSGVPAFTHVFIIVMENLGYARAVRLPYISSLAAQYGVATRYFAATHPSLPNYLALTSGETWVRSDCWYCYVSSNNLGAEASAAGVSWGAYMEGLPGPCWLGPWWPTGDYAGKHDPFRYYRDIRGSTALCAGIRPLADLEVALGAAPGPSSGSSAPGPAAAVPRLVWITPNLCHDMHDCSPQVGDAWLRSFVPRILASPAWKGGGALFITWDEGLGTEGCCTAGPPSAPGAAGPSGTGQAVRPTGGGGQVLTLVLAPGVPAGTRIAVPYNHYSLLATVEDGLGLPLLGHAAQATPMSAFWTPSALSKG